MDNDRLTQSLRFKLVPGIFRISFVCFVVRLLKSSDIFRVFSKGEFRIVESRVIIFASCVR